MGRCIKMDVLPLIKVGRDLRVKYDDANVACAQPLHYCRYVGGPLLLRETKAEIVGPRLQDDDVGTLGHRAVDALKHAGGCDAEDPGVDDVGRNGLHAQ